MHGPGGHSEQREQRQISTCMPLRDLTGAWWLSTSIWVASPVVGGASQPQSQVLPLLECISMDRWRTELEVRLPLVCRHAPPSGGTAGATNSTGARACCRVSTHPLCGRVYPRSGRATATLRFGPGRTAIVATGGDRGCAAIGYRCPSTSPGAGYDSRALSQGMGSRRPDRYGVGFPPS